MASNFIQSDSTKTTTQAAMFPCTSCKPTATHGHKILVRKNYVNLKTLHQESSTFLHKAQQALLVYVFPLDLTALGTNARLYTIYLSFSDKHL
jgi:hypothetical protein